MVLLGLALFLSILPADAFYGNATISNTAGRAPVPTAVSPSKPPMNMTTTTHAMSQYLNSSKPYGANVPDAIVVPESIESSTPIPLSCLRPDVICTLKTTLTKIIATKTVPNAIPIETTQSMETGPFAEGNHNNTTGVVKTDTPSQTTTGSDGSPSASKEKPVFSYDPIKISTISTETDNIASPSPTTSGSLNALSVLESALSAFTTTSSPINTMEVSSSNQSSGWIYFPFPTAPSESSSHTREQPSGTSASESTASMSTTHVSSPASVITSPGTSLTLSDNKPEPHFTLRPTSYEQLPKAESRSSTADYASQSGASLTYSPLQSTSTSPSPSASSPTQTILAFGSLTVTVGAVSTLSQVVSVGGITLSAGGAPVTLEQGEVLSYATDGLVVANPSGVVQSMSTVAAPQETGQDASGELPEVVQQPAPSDSETTSAADAASTGSSEAEGDASNGSKRLVQANGMALGVIVALVIFAI